MASDDLTPERARHISYIPAREIQLLVTMAMDARLFKSGGRVQRLEAYTDKIAAAWTADHAALAAAEARLATVTAQRDALARIAAFELYEDSLVPYDHHYIEASVALAAIRAEQTTTTEPTNPEGFE
jgi:multidrug efflux pump subunit AcrA (membrane-fusion protein)